MTAAEVRTRTTAREYLRVSEDKTGEKKSTVQQHADNERTGFEFGEPYSEDVAISASRFTNKVRGGYERLVADLESGEFGADVLVLWESSRGSRRLSEWARLIETCEAAGVKIHVTSDDNTYDPADARDRETLQQDGVAAEAESSKISKRVRRDSKALAAKGQPVALIPYGYMRTYKTVGRSRYIDQQLPDPDEAPVVQEIFKRIKNRESLKSIVRDFEARGIRTRNGIVMSTQFIRDLALRPGYVGLRMHRPGNKTGKYQGSLEGAVKATWPPLVDTETFYSVREILLDPSRKTSRPGKSKHLLSMLAECGVCGGPLTATYRKPARRREYQCRDKSCVRINAADLDGFVVAVVLAYIAREADGLRAEAGKTGGAELEAVRGKLAEQRAELASLQKEAEDGKISVATVVRMEGGIVKRIAKLEQQERELSTPPALAGLLDPDVQAQTWWAALPDVPPAAKREVIRMLSSPDLLGQIKLGRSPSPGTTVAVSERVTWGRD